MTSILWRDIILAFRSGGGFGLGVGLFLIIVVLVPFAIGSNVQDLQSVAAGMLWIGALLACLISLDRIFALDYEDGTLDLLATSPIPLEGVVAMKAVAHWITTSFPLIIIAPLLGFLLHLPEKAYIWLILSLFLGTPALSFIGSFGAALTVGVKRGGLLLSLLILPLYIPTLIFGVEVIKRGVEGASIQTPLLLLTSISLLSIAILPLAAAAALRISLR